MLTSGEDRIVAAEGGDGGVASSDNAAVSTSAALESRRAASANAAPPAKSSRDASLFMKLSPQVDRSSSNYLLARMFLRRR